MKNKSKLLTLSVFSLLVITGCKTGNKPTSSTIGPSNTPDSSQIGPAPTSSTSKPTPNSNTTIDGIKVFDNYDAYIDNYSQSGHLYIHYLREGATAADYSQYGLWLWPISKQGALFAGQSTNPNITSNTSGWMPTIGENGMIDQAGVCADIDLNSTTYVTGRDNNEFSLKDVNRIGYLVVQLASMDGGSHWVSDGGGDGYINDVTINARANGAIHVFLTSGSVRTPRFYYSEETYTNPVISDTTGNYRSNGDIVSSTSKYPVAPTSRKFKKEGKVGYQVFIPTFADSNGDGFGDLRGLINKLDYLDDLSIDTLWLSPFLTSNSYHGYDTVDFFEVDERFGTKNDLRELITKSHAKGMKLIMDLVINHTSSSSIWFKKAQRAEEGTDSDGKKFNYRDLFHFKFKGDVTEGTTKVENDSDWYRDGESQYYYYAKFASDMPELNYDAQITRDMINEVANYWLGFGFDGYRLDAVKHIYMSDESKNAAGDVILEDKTSRTYYDEQLGKEVTVEMDYSTNQTKNLAFWKEFSARLKAVYPDCYLVAENFDGWDERIAPYYQVFDSQFDFNEYYHNLEYVYLNMGQYAKDLATTTNTKLNNYFSSQRSDFINATFTSNHDVSRAINHINSTKESMLGAEIDARITGTSEQINRAKIHAAITILQPGVSFIYYGDELGMSSNTKENTYNHTNNLDRFYRQPMKWSSNENELCFITFGEGYSNDFDSYNKTLASASAQANDANSMLSFYKAINAVKADDRFPVEGTFTGYAYDVNPNIYHAVIAPKSAGQSTYKIYINTGANGVGDVAWGLGATDEIVYSYNATESVLRPYSVVVTRTK